MSVHSLSTNNVFDAETMKILASAFDAAWEEIKTSDGSPAGERHVAETRVCLPDTLWPWLTEAREIPID
jgi:hypothetical protein